MKKILTLLLLTPLLGFSQVNCDTVYMDDHNQEYIHSRTRGFWFRANSSFIISAIKAGEGDSVSNGVNATEQSIEIIQFTGLNLTTDTIPEDVTAIFAGLSNPHTSLFHAQNVPYGWITCNVNIVQDRYYAVLGAKNNTVFPGQATDMYNSYIAGGVRKLLFNGDSTVFWRAGIQHSLADGPGPSGQFFHDGPDFQGRIHTLICTGSTSVEEFTTDRELIKVVDLLGRNSKSKKNIPLFYIYNDGTTEKRIIIK